MTRFDPAVLDPRSPDQSTDTLLDVALPVGLLVAATAWLPAAVLLLGYAVRVLRAELRGDDRLPSLADVRSLARTGLRAAAVVTVFQLPTLLAFGASLELWRDGRGYLVGSDPAFAFTDPAAFAHVAVLAPGRDPAVVAAFACTVVVAFLTGYLATVALVAFAATGRLGAGFDTDVLLGGVRSSSFRLAFLLASVLSVVGAVLAGFVAVVPVVGPFAAAFVHLFVLVGALRVVADGFDVDAILTTEGNDDSAAARSIDPDAVA